MNQYMAQPYGSTMWHELTVAVHGTNRGHRTWNEPWHYSFEYPKRRHDYY